MPNKKVNEMFALASQILGGRRVTVLCEDGETRMARIPGKMRRRQWVREGDLIIVWPWDFQDSKADVKHRYTKTQAMYLSRKGVLPDDVDMFGMGVSLDDDGEHDDLFASGAAEDEPRPAMTGTICSQMTTVMTTCLQMTTVTTTCLLRMNPKRKPPPKLCPKRKRLLRLKNTLRKSLRAMTKTMTTTSMRCLLEFMRKPHGPR